MSDALSALHIKQEVDNGSAAIAAATTTTTAAAATTTTSASCYSPTGTGYAGSAGVVNRSNSYSNGANTSSSSAGGGCKSSPSVSPDRQLCSSTTTLSSDLHSVSLNSELGHASSSSPYPNGATRAVAAAESTAANGGGGGGGGGATSMRDELRRLCLVCGDVASGFHYGVASCEACKAFFKRTIQGNIEYTCPANNECEINKRRRKACQACRFQKCLLMGMLKEGVRLDRVRGGRQKYRRNPVSNSYQTMQLLYQSGTTSLEDVKILDVLNVYEPEALTVQQQQQQQAHTTTAAVAAGERQFAAHVKIEQSHNRTPTPTAGDNNATTTTTSTPTTTTAAAKTPTTAAATPGKTAFPGGTCIFQNNNNNDPQEVLCVLSDLYDKELVCVIGWAKQIPGFTELPLNDQMKLLQVSWAEILTLQLTFRSLPFNGKLCFATDVWMDELLAKDCGYSEFYYHCVQIAQRLERLSPRREEYFLLKALLLSNCDILLDDQSSLRAFRDTILGALNDVVYLLRHSAAVSHQQQLLLLLPSLRQADGILRRFWRNICREGNVTMKRLFAEMLEPLVR